MVLNSRNCVVECTSFYPRLPTELPLLTATFFVISLRCLANLDIYLRQLDSSGIQNYDPDKANVLKTCFLDRTCSACSRPCDLISRLDEGNPCVVVIVALILCDRSFRLRDWFL